jgi:hypothetical protein
MLSTVWTLAKYLPVIGTALVDLEEMTERFNYYADESNDLPDNYLDMLGIAR